MCRVTPHRLVLVSILAGCAGTPDLSHTRGTEDLTLDQLFRDNEFAARGFRPTRWLGEGDAYTTLERAEGGGTDIVRYDAATGARQVLVPAISLTPRGASQALPVRAYSWSEDGRKLLVFTNTRKVWRDHTRGDYWVLDVDRGTLRQLGTDFDATWLMFAKFSPDGNRVGYVYKNDIYVEEIATGRVTRITDDGSRTTINGTFDWAYEEELGLQDGFRWSPDGDWIAYWQLDAEGVRDFLMIDNLSGPYSQTVPVQYPKVGTTNSASRVGIVSSRGGDTTWMQVPGDPRNHYLARMEWAANSDALVLQQLPRLQNRNKVMFADRATGAVRAWFEDRDDAWIDVGEDALWLDGGHEMTWVSERDGWRHVYRVARTSSEWQLVTPGDYDVISVAHIDTAGGHVYFIASPDNATQRFLYRAPLAGGPPERITPTDAVGDHSYDISPNARWAIHRHSSFGVPPKIELVHLPDHRVVRTFVDNQELVDKLAKVRRGPSEFFRIDIGDGVELDGWVVKPPDFDPSKKYPVLFHVYGEPAATTVRDRWGTGSHLWNLLLAQRGIVVMNFDNRGTPAPKGREWRKCVYGQIGILASADQAAAVRAAQKRWSWIDRDRIASWGWSGGGSMTLNALFRYPDLYHVGIAIAFVANQLYYDTIYQERYMGLPETNPDGFRDGSPITFAKNLEGDLLLIHGTADDNVHYQNCDVLVDELVTHGKQFSLMAYPGRAHGLRERNNTRRHLFEMMTTFLEERLLDRRH